MGMPGSETALEKLTLRVLGNCIQDGIVARLADDLYCGGNTLDELHSNWKKSPGCTTEIQFKVVLLKNSNFS